MSRGYVLLTCLYLLALLSMSSIVAVQTASLMAQHARLLDSRARASGEAAGQLVRIEAALLGGESLAEPDVWVTHAACDSRMGPWIRVARLDSRRIDWVDSADKLREAEVITYGLRVCEDGSARLETSLAVLRPASLLGDASLPSDLVLGRLSWREVW